MDNVPIIDVSALVGGAADPGGAAEEIGAACRDSGFFYIVGHGVPGDLLARLDAASRAFFALPEAEKLEISMDRGGRAWRGYFPIGAELTSGRPDVKEGIYFGTELPETDARVRAGAALHFFAEVPPLPGRARRDAEGRTRWDGADLQAFTGTYGDYLLAKVSKVFPQLRAGVL